MLKNSTNKQETSTLTDKSGKINKEEKQENHKEINSSNSEKQKEDSIIESRIANKKERLFVNCSGLKKS